MNPHVLSILAVLNARVGLSGEGLTKYLLEAISLAQSYDYKEIREDEHMTALCTIQ